MKNIFNWHENKNRVLVSAHGTVFVLPLPGSHSMALAGMVSILKGGSPAAYDMRPLLERKATSKASGCRSAVPTLPDRYDAREGHF